METIKLTSKDFNERNQFNGDDSVLNYKGNLEIEENLGIVSFEYLNIKGNITTKEGTGIYVEGYIYAGGDIEAGGEISWNNNK